MKRIGNIQKISLAGIGLCLLLVFASCIKEGGESCGLDLRLRYVYNMQQADGLSQEVSRVRLWVFNEEQQLVATYEDQQEQLPAHYVLTLPPMAPGLYTFAVVAEGCGSPHPFSFFEIPELRQGEELSDLTERVRRDDRGVNSVKINALLLGTKQIRITGRAQQDVIDLMKCTNTIRVLLLSADGNVPLAAADWETYIEGQNGWLAYDGATHQKSPVIYRPYLQQMRTYPEEDGRENRVWVAEMSTSRLLYDLHPRLVIRNRVEHKEVVNLDLTRLLSLLSIGEHQETWSSQEYLDRQDEYALTFVLEGTTWLQTRVVVNGWVLSMSDVGL